MNKQQKSIETLKRENEFMRNILLRIVASDRTHTRFAELVIGEAREAIEFVDEGAFEVDGGYCARG